MKKTGLVFEEEKHLYSLDGHPVVGVTSTLSEAFGDPYAQISAASRQYALELGKAVHRWTVIDDGPEDQRVEPSSDQMRGYLAAWRKFKCENVTVIEGIEQQVFSRRYQYAGTLDRILMMNNLLGGNKKGRVLIDIKSGTARYPYDALQTIAYQIAWEEMNHPHKIYHRATVMIHQDGNYELVWHCNKTDRNVWLAVLSVIGWKHAHNIKAEVPI